MSTSCVQMNVLGVGIHLLEIHRPEALNALNTEVLNELQSKIAFLSNDPGSSVVVIRGSGEKAFVAGADIKEMVGYSSGDALRFSKFGQNVFQSLSTLPQVVIAQVQGFALGGGLELALAADFIIASEKAKFGLPEVGLGLIPGFGGTQRLVNRLGYSRALEWMTSAERFSSETAYQHGLVNRIVRHEDLSSAVETIATMIAAQGPCAVRAAKKSAQTAARIDVVSGYDVEAQLFSECFSRDESREGLDAFVSRRKPEFRKSHQS